MKELLCRSWRYRKCKPIDGVWTVRLRSCYLDYHANIHAVALACRGVDYIKLWPVEQPWQETPDSLPGGYARR